MPIFKFEIAFFSSLLLQERSSANQLLRFKVKHFIQPETKQCFRLCFSLDFSEGICSGLTCSDFSVDFFESPANQTVPCLLSRGALGWSRDSAKHVSSWSLSPIHAATKSPFFFASAIWIGGSIPAHCASAGRTHPLAIVLVQGRRRGRKWKRDTFLLTWSLPTCAVAIQHCIAHSDAFLQAVAGTPRYNLYRKTIPHDVLPVWIITSSGGFSYILLTQIYEVQNS